MNRMADRPSLVASPVLVGAVTVLVAFIAVFIAYNANAGLPFVPTYDVKAELPSGDKLVGGNEGRGWGVRVGGWGSGGDEVGVCSRRFLRIRRPPRSKSVV